MPYQRRERYEQYSRSHATRRNDYNHSSDYYADPPSRKSRRSDYITRPVYSHSDYISPHEWDHRHARSSRKHGSGFSGLDYIRHSAQSDDDHITAQVDSRNSVSAYPDQYNNTDYISDTDISPPHPPPPQNSFCTPMSSSKPAKVRPKSYHSSFSAPYEDHPKHQQVDDDGSKRKRKSMPSYGFRPWDLDALDQGNNISDDFERGHDQHRSPSSYHADHDEGFDDDGSDCQVEPPNTRGFQDDKDGYTSDYQETPQVSRRDSHSGSDVVSTGNTAPQPSSFSTPDIDHQPKQPRRSARRRPVYQTASSSFCSPPTPPRRQRSVAFEDERYRSDEEDIAPNESFASSRGALRGGGCALGGYGSDVEIASNGSSRWGSDCVVEGSDYEEEEGYFRRGGRHRHGEYDDGDEDSDEVYYD